MPDTSNKRPLAARAQLPAMVVIGYLAPGPPEAGANFVAAFRKGQREAGYVEGRDRLPEQVADRLTGENSRTVAGE